jgi:hypothetical protein
MARAIGRRLQRSLDAVHQTDGNVVAYDAQGPDLEHGNTLKSDHPIRDAD